MLSEYSTAAQIQEESGNDTAILPIGSTEQHGSHLPVATDHMIARAYARVIGEKIGAYVLPTLPISTCREHMGRRGSVWIKPVTLYNVIEDIVMSLKYQGFKTIIVLIAHGGIFISGPVIRELNATNPDIRVIRLETMQFDNTPEMLEVVECRDNLHACEIETSLIMYLDRSLVKEENISDFVPDVTRDYLNYRSMLAYTESGVWGKPSLASAEKGRKIFDIVVKKSVEYINEVIKKTGGKGYVEI